MSQIVQGLVIHQYMASAYGVTVSEARSAESHIRHVDEMLDRIFAIDPSPLTVARPPEKRLVGVCHHFSLLFVAMLRAHGIPARYRQGFGTYFNPPNA
ncbi:MAG TPA: transglutaminase-like domain-containing protein, partial [Gemmatimonadaceae bacterium]|nr:transglutaminase-like domain-containing protein [Gemmatimonadaceae bacterium]